MKWLLGISMTLGGAFFGGLLGLVVASDFIFRAADGARLPGCGNVGMEPGVLIGFALGAGAGVWFGRRRAEISS
jgi:hypothetical protein